MLSKKERIIWVERPELLPTTYPTDHSKSWHKLISLQKKRNNLHPPQGEMFIYYLQM